eukprot:Tbor_TRINITY_DN4194_c0_g1::TRINITY_DN4194_c0_g1_i1::g.26514::m.26514/K07897/RAB7A; Ras-related protein Rab-7A
MPKSPNSRGKKTGSNSLNSNQQRRTVLKIILLGDSGVGKTSLMRQYVSNRFEKRYKATIGADFFSHQEIIEGVPVDLQIWDTAGQERFQSLGAAFYRGADACLLCFDITNAQSFQNLRTWIQEFTYQANGIKDMLLIGNKADLQERRQVFKKNIDQFCTETVEDLLENETLRSSSENGNTANSNVSNGTVRKDKSDNINNDNNGEETNTEVTNKLQYFETSAKDNSSVKEAFHAIATAAYYTKTKSNLENEHNMMPFPKLIGHKDFGKKKNSKQSSDEDGTPRKCSC